MIADLPWLRPVKRFGLRSGDVACLFAILALGVLITLDAWRDIVRVATKDEESSHILLVPIIALWIAWVRRGRLRHCKLRAQWIGPLLAAVGAAAYIVGDQFLWQSVWHAGAILVAVGSALTVLGLDVAKAFLPALLVLCFLIPVPGRVRQRIAIPLQEATASITQRVSELGGLDVQQSGSVLRSNGVDVAIAEACNGMRMTFALVLVSYAFAFTTPLRPSVRVLIVCLSPFSAVLCNVIRLVPTVYVFGHFSEKAALAFHDASGWVMLFVAFILLLSVIRLMRWMSIPVSPFRFAQA